MSCAALCVSVGKTPRRWCDVSAERLISSKNVNFIRMSSKLSFVGIYLLHVTINLQETARGFCALLIRNVLLISHRRLLAREIHKYSHY